jgi:hypothetical protein
MTDLPDLPEHQNPNEALDLERKIAETPAASPDGLRWKVINEDTPYRHHHFQRMIWDEAIQRWIAYSQYSPHWNFLHRKRQVGRQESVDAIPHKQNWFGPPPGFPIIPQADFEAGRRTWEARSKLTAGLPQWERSINALILREDGWAELRPTYETGQVITRQFVFEGDTLKLNADCGYGFIRVELLDPHFAPYPGFAAAECDPVFGPRDQTWHTVSWQGKQDVRALWNKPCRLRFHLQQATLYAFQVDQRSHQ